MSQFLLIIAIVGIADFVMPSLTRPDLLFSVTVKPAFAMSAEADAIKRRYRIFIAILTTLAFLIALGGFPKIAIAFEGSGSLVAFLLARRTARPHEVPPSAEREVSMEPHRNELPGGAIMQAGPFLVLIGVGAYLAMRWSAIPPHFPIHWDSHDRPNGWMDRNIGGVYLPLMLGVIACALNLIVNMVIARTRRISVTGARGYAEARFRKAVIGIGIVIQYLLAFSFGIVALLPLRRNPEQIPPLGAILGPVFALVVLFVIAQLFIGQGGSRLVQLSVNDPPIGDRTPDRHWLLGLVYFNRDDPAWLVEKRFGIGYTLNYAAPRAWLFLLMTLAFIVVLVLLPRWINP